ncbi:MAG: hypothetical protein AAF483_30160 [Planctomycetota bacterium]
MRPNLELPDTKLAVFDDEIVRSSDDNQSTLLRLPLSEVRAASCHRAINSFGIVCIVAALGMVGIGWELVESNLFSGILYVLALLSAAFGLFAITEMRLVLECESGSQIIATQEPKDVVEGFVGSLNSQLRSGPPKS